ncbi:MAG: hypothetical protein ACK4NF_07305, partial [Planctomycetota bacterium]
MSLNRFVNFIKNNIKFNFAFLRFTLYVIASLLFLYILFKKVILPVTTPVSIQDVSRAFIFKQFDKVIYLSKKLELGKPQEENKLNSYLALSNAHLYIRTKDRKFAYNAINDLLNIKNKKTHWTVLKKVLKIIISGLEDGKVNKEIITDLLYYYVERRNTVSGKELNILLRYTPRDRKSLSLLASLLNKTSKKYRVLYRLALIYYYDDDYKTALKHLQTARGLSSDVKFIKKTDKLLLKLHVLSGNCSIALKEIGKFLSVKKDMKYLLLKLYCQDVMGILNTETLLNFIRENRNNTTIMSNPVLELMFVYLQVKLQLYQGDYDKVVDNLSYIVGLNNPGGAIVKKENILFEV